MQFWSTLLLPAIIGRVFILVKYFTKVINAEDLELGYKIVAFGQIVIAHIYIAMVLTLYKSFLVNVSSTLKSEGRSYGFVFAMTNFMYLYSWTLLSAGIFWMAAGCKYLCEKANVMLKQRKLDAIWNCARPYNPTLFTEHKECVICMIEFENKKSKVIVLPCDVRHYFHVKCIQVWTLQHSSCPLCKRSYST